MCWQELANAWRVKNYKAKGEGNKADIGTKPITAKTLEKFYEWLCIEKSGFADVIDDRMIDDKVVTGFDSSLMKKLLGGAVFATMVSVCKGEEDDAQCDPVPMERDRSHDWKLIVMMAYCLLHLVLDVLGLYRGFKDAGTTRRVDCLLVTADGAAEWCTVHD